MTDIAELTPDALRRKLAERLGYVRGEELSPFVVYGDVSRGVRHIFYRWVRPDGSYGEASLLNEFGDNTMFPDWPRDVGAALALCLEIAAPGWHLDIEQLHTGECAVAFTFVSDVPESGTNIVKRASIVVTGYPLASALSRLALTVLRAESAGDRIPPGCAI